MTRRVSAWVLLLALALATPALARDPGAGTATFVVVVGTTRPDRPGLTTLRYADDDAARWYELASSFAERVELLTVLDDDTQARHPGLAASAKVPTREALAAALARTRTAIDGAKREGRSTAFWFVFAGHGDVGDNKEGYLVLHDGRFTRTDLYEQVIGASNADVNHVVLDACRAWFMVSRRGGAAPAAAIRELLDAQSLDRYPNTGVLLATTESAEVHEWDRYRAGVFSHQVRSALLGGADVDGDGKVGYLEVAAFITAANAKVTDPRGKLSIAAVPPAGNRAAALVEWSSNGSRTTRVRVAAPGTAEGAAHGSFRVEDDRGVRLADLHPAPGAPVTLHLPGARPFTFRGAGWESAVAAAPGTRVELAELGRTEPALASRGDVGDAFERGLFAQPFGAAYYDGFVAANPRGLWPVAPPVIARTRTWRSPAAWTSASGAAVAGGFALWEAERSRAASERYRSAFGTEREIAALRTRAERSRRTAWVAAGTSAAFATASGWLFVSERRGVSIAATESGDLSVAIAFTFGGEP